MSTNMRSIDAFRDKGRSLEQQFRKAVYSGDRIYLPPRLYVLAEPIEFEHALLLKGHLGKFYSRDLLQTTEIRAHASLGARPLFHRRGYYLSHTDVWNTSEDTTADLGLAASVGCGLTVQVEDIAFQTTDENSCIMQVYNASNPTYVKNCAFGNAYRGLLMLNVFGGIVENCTFQGTFRYPWLADTERVKRGWGLCVGNNITITQCNWQGGLVGIQAIGTGNTLTGGRIERNIYGMRIGFKNLNPDGQFGSIWASSYSTFTGFTMESNLFGLDARAGQGTRMSEFCVTGTNAPQLDGISDGPCEYGIKAEYLANTNTLQNCAISGNFRQAPIVGGYTKNTGIIERNGLTPVRNI